MVIRHLEIYQKIYKSRRKQNALSMRTLDILMQLSSYTWGVKLKGTDTTFKHFFF